MIKAVDILDGNRGEVDWQAWSTNVKSGSLSMREPPEKLKRCHIIDSNESNYILLFPLELTNKDYARRVLDTVANGISEQVLVIAKCAVGKVEPFPVDKNQFDLFYLLSAMKGYSTKVYVKALRCHGAFSLLESLLRYRNSLFHMEKGINAREDVSSVIKAAKVLLECFSVPGNE
jgi:hypothetical protein